MAFEPAETQYLFDAPRPLNSLASDFIQQYRAKRYLRELNDSALDVRSNDIVSNLMVLGTDGKYRPQFNIREDGLYAPVRNLDLLRMAVDVWEEYRLRARLHSAGHDRTGLALAERLADESWCRRAAWEEGSRLSKDRYEQPRMLFRFSEKPEWNHSFLERSSFYVFVPPRSTAIEAWTPPVKMMNWRSRGLTKRCNPVCTAHRTTIACASHPRTTTGCFAISTRRAVLRSTTPRNSGVESGEPSRSTTQETVTTTSSRSRDVRCSTWIRSQWGRPHMPWRSSL